MKRLVPPMALALLSLLFALGANAQPAASKPAASAPATSAGTGAATARQLSLAALVDEIDRAAVGHVDPDHPALQHPVKIALPGLGGERELPGLRGARGAG